jgi:hypothetical protein
MFSSGSRYQGAGAPYQVSLPDGRTVLATPLPPPVPAPARGYHRRTGTDRLDLLAFRYLGDANNAMVPAALAARALIVIPGAGA